MPYMYIVLTLGIMGQHQESDGSWRDQEMYVINWYFH